MITSFPSVTWPSHTSLITGVQPARHGVIGNSVWSRKLDRPLTYIGDPELTKAEAIQSANAVRRGPPGRAEMRQRHLAVLQRRPIRWTGSFPTPAGPICTRNTRRPASSPSWARRASTFRKLGDWGWNKDRSTDRDVLYTKVAQYLLRSKRRIWCSYIWSRPTAWSTPMARTRRRRIKPSRKRSADRGDLEDAARAAVGRPLGPVCRLRSRLCAL